MEFLGTLSTALKTTDLRESGWQISTTVAGLTPDEIVLACFELQEMSFVNPEKRLCRRSPRELNSR